MNSQVWWHLSRASGIVAWVLLAASVVWGLVLSTRVLGRRSNPAWTLDFHRFLGALALVFTALHLGGLVADSYVHFGTADLLVPFASSWKRNPVALGVVAFWLLVAVEVTSLFMRHLPRRIWHRIHLLSLPMFALASFHGAAAGTDAQNALYRRVSMTLVIVATALVLVRVVIGRRSVARERREQSTPTIKVAA